MDRVQTDTMAFLANNAMHMEQTKGHHIRWDIAISTVMSITKLFYLDAINITSNKTNKDDYAIRSVEMVWQH